MDEEGIANDAIGECAITFGSYSNDSESIVSGTIESNDDAGLGPTALASGPIESNEKTELPEREGTVIAMTEAMEAVEQTIRAPRESSHKVCSPPQTKDHSLALSQGHSQALSQARSRAQLFHQFDEQDETQPWLERIPEFSAFTMAEEYVATVLGWGFQCYEDVRYLSAQLRIDPHMPGLGEFGAQILSIMQQSLELREKRFDESTSCPEPPTSSALALFPLLETPPTVITVLLLKEPEEGKEQHQEETWKEPYALHGVLRGGGEQAEWVRAVVGRLFEGCASRAYPQSLLSTLKVPTAFMPGSVFQ